MQTTTTSNDRRHRTWPGHDLSDVAIWWRWWAIAAFAHVVGTPTVDGDLGRGVPNLIVGWIALAVLVRPDPAGPPAPPWRWPSSSRRWPRRR